MLMVIVGADGLPRDIRVTRSLGHGRLHEVSPVDGLLTERDARPDLERQPSVRRHGDPAIQGVRRVLRRRGTSWLHGTVQGRAVPVQINVVANFRLY